jgi:hypothetical protein
MARVDVFVTKEARLFELATDHGDSESIILISLVSALHRDLLYQHGSEIP